jgi:hypothetical protein
MQEAGMQESATQESAPNPPIPSWEGEGYSRIPFWAYTNTSVYERELERIFYSKHWSYVGLEAEIPNHVDRRTLDYPGARCRRVHHRGREYLRSSWRRVLPRTLWQSQGAPVPLSSVDL